MNRDSTPQQEDAAPTTQPAASDVVVSFRGVKKTYDGQSLVVKQLDLDIRRGEFLTLLGPSGSGKTTCLMMLAGFEYPTAGEIRLEDERINRVPPHRRNIGMVFQSYALFPHMTVSQNVAYPLRVRGRKDPERAGLVAKALEMVQMRKFEDRYPAQLSGGQQQRVALARALVFEPKLVLMDEPLGALDKQLREHMQLELKALHQRLGVTFVYVTHDQGEALTMSDRVAVFDQGIIQQLDAVEPLYEAPVNQFVAGFIGDNNRLFGVVESAEAGRCVLRLRDATPLPGVSVGTLSKGAEAAACVRPERLRLKLGPGSAGALRATVQGLIYFGDHVRVRCAVPGQEECFVKLAPSDPALAGLAVGGEVVLEADPKHVRVLL
jgi:putative spermidine/putrescine transport system ATP-binding protein